MMNARQAFLLVVFVGSIPAIVLAFLWLVDAGSYMLAGASMVLIFVVFRIVAALLGPRMKKWATKP